jgi:uncharacterized surface protein with fasciclin (FAS1) repeats
MVRAQRFVTRAAIAAPLWIVAPPAGAGDVIETMREASSSGQFEIDAFATAIEAAGLADVLEGAGSHTIFAPTNEAFQRLDLGGPKAPGTAGTLEEQLQSADRQRLSETLKHYIVEGRMPVDQLMEQEQLQTLQGAKLEISAAKGGVLVNDIEVLKPDIVADNGVIHVIGGLLTPETADQTPPQLRDRDAIPHRLELRAGTEQQQ